MSATAGMPNFSKRETGRLRAWWSDAERAPLERYVFGLAILIAMLMFLVPNYGQSWDVHYNEFNGVRAYNYYFRGFDAAEFRRDHKDLFYGPVIDLIIHRLQRTTSDPYQKFLIRGFVQAILSWSVLIPLFLIASRLLSAPLALVATGVVILTPALFGHNFMNPKDSIFTAGFIWSLYWIIRLSEGRVRLLQFAGLGALIGAVTTLRYLSAYLLLIAPLALIYLPALAGRPADHGFWRTLVALHRRYLAAMLVLAAAFLVTYTLLMPGLLSDLRPGSYVEVLRTFARFQWTGSILYFGKQVSSVSLPWHYIYGYLYVQLPLTYHLFLLCTGAGAMAFAVRALRARGFSLAAIGPRGRVLTLIVLTLAVPFVLIAATRPVLYDAFRHVLFVVPLIGTVLFAGFVWTLDMLRPRWRLALASVAGLLALQAGGQIVRLHPYEYAYYNPLVSPVGAFELDYWATSFREVTEWMNDHARANTRAGERLKVAVCGPQPSMGPFLAPDKYQFTEFADADYVVALNRWDCLDKLKGPWLFSVQRGNWVLAAVARR